MNYMALINNTKEYKYKINHLNRRKNMYLQDISFLQRGKYKIVRHISSGGFGNTYEGVHAMMDTRVAIKEFFPRLHSY